MQLNDASKKPTSWLENVNYGRSRDLAGYWYVKIRTGANGSVGQLIICTSREQARKIAAALMDLL